MPPSGYPGVFVAYASVHDAAFIDRARSLPRAWAKDPDRRTAAGIPVGRRFASTITRAERMLARAFAARVPARWVVANPVSGRSGSFRRWLEEREQPDAVMLPRTNAIDYRGRRIRVEQVAERLPTSAPTPWLCLALAEGSADGMGHWLLIHRDADDPSAERYWLAYGPAGTTEEELVRVCDARWQGEECFAQAKGAVGMDQYEVRTWTAWYRFVTLCLVAHARVPAGWHDRRSPGCWRRRGRGEGGGDPGLIPLTIPETRRLVLAMAADNELRAFRLAWSHWRRAQQAVAARCHAARRARKQRNGGRIGSVSPLLAIQQPLTAGEWERIEPLLPPQKPPTGRPRHDHRTVLNGILSVVGTELSWREMPQEYGNRYRAYKR